MAQRWVQNTTSQVKFVDGKALLPGEGVFVDDGPLPQPLPGEASLTADELASFRGLVSPDRILIGRGQIKVGTFGDSIANINSIANQDLRRLSAVGSMSVDRMGTALIEATGGNIRIVFNGGVSGETTTQMLARDAAGASATRRALTDAIASECQFLVFAMGINDFQHSTLPNNSTSAEIDDAVATTLANTLKLLRRCMGLGMVPIIHPVLGYTYNAGSTAANNTLANILTTQTAAIRFNALLKAAVEGASGALGHYVDSFYDSVVNSTGDWIATDITTEGLHPNYNGCKLIYPAIAQKILTLAGGPGISPFAYPVATPLFNNSDFSASSSGLATGVTTATLHGTVTRVNSLNEFRGQLWQDVLCTPTVLDGAGYAGVRVDIAYTSAGILLNDVLGGEVSLFIDDGAGGPPVGVYQHCARMRANTVYSDTPGYNQAANPRPPTYRGPIDARIALQPIVAPSAAPPTTNLSVIVYTQSLTPFRIRVARPKVTTLAATY